MAEDGETPAEEELDDWYLRRMNAGLAHLQNIDYVLAWVIMEDDGVCPDFWDSPYDTLTDLIVRCRHKITQRCF
jgi:hypothetical protein